MTDSPDTAGQILARMGTDAAKWTDEFMRIAAANPAIATDWGTMVGWFASAIETGRSAGQGELAAARATIAELQNQSDGWRKRAVENAEDYDRVCGKYDRACGKLAKIQALANERYAVMPDAIRAALAGDPR